MRSRTSRGARWLACAALGMAGAAFVCAAEAQNAAVGDGPLEAELDVYVGWRTFTQYCARCHGADGQGSSFAPELAPRVARMTRNSFEQIMANGYRGVESDMPAWGDNRDVRQYAPALWAYLSARASGDLPPGEIRLARGATSD